MNNCFRARAPPNTQEYIVFPFNYKTTTYDLNSADIITFTQGVSNERRVKDFLKSLENILKSTGFIESNSCSLIISYLFLFFIVVTMAIIAGLVFANLNLDSGLFEILLPVSLIILFILMIMVNKRVQKNLDISKSEIESMLLRESVSIEQLGFRWILPEKFPDWIELWKLGQSEYRPPSVEIK